MEGLVLTEKYQGKKKGFTWECHEKAHRELNLIAAISDIKY